ncbi:MAG: molybdopterin synthase sulfur carrier subunit [Bacteroidetes bacterium]|nr:molybdopterin synthase sulfur carrier subunit [Bacteroidota bacterium]
MPITVLFFGALTELTKTDRLALDAQADAFIDLAGLNTHLEQLYPGLSDKPYRVAINQEFAGEGDPLRDGDEVAFLPPYAGG